MRHSRTRRAPLLVAALASLATVLVVGTGAATADPSISSKREQAQAILGQIREMDSTLSHAIESYNLANVQLDEIDADLETNGRHLTIAQGEPRSRAAAHRQAAARALHQRGLRQRGRGDPRRPEPRRPARPPRHGPARRRPGRRGADRRTALPQRGQDPPREAEVRPRPAGADRCRARGAQALDRGTARGAPEAARLREGRDRTYGGGRATQAGTARGTGARQARSRGCGPRIGTPADARALRDRRPTTRGQG